MDDALLWLLLLVVGLFVLVKSANYFNTAAENIGISLGLSPFIIGVLLVAVGTSLPELVSSVISVVKGSSEIVPGNVLGSNITNIFLIIGIISIVPASPITLTGKAITIDLRFLLVSAFFLAITIYDGVFNIYEGILCMVAFSGYIVYQASFVNKPIETGTKPAGSQLKNYLIFLVSTGMIYVSAELTVEAIIRLSDYLGIGRDVVAASMVAVGTSLPELSVSVTAIRKGNVDIAIGNILGSCVFNALWVMGFSSLFGDIIIPPSVISITLPFMLIASVLFSILARDRSFSRWEGFLFLLFYLLFLAKLFDIF